MVCRCVQRENGARGRGDREKNDRDYVKHGGVVVAIRRGGRFSERGRSCCKAGTAEEVALLITSAQ